MRRLATLGAALHQLDRQAEAHKLPGLLVADCIGPEVAETLHAQGRAFQPTGLQVLFALLCHPEWVNLPYRELATPAARARPGLTQSLTYA